MIQLVDIFDIKTVLIVFLFDNGVLFENRPALYCCNYIIIIAYKTYIFF